MSEGLQRFRDAQKDDYDIALSEIKSGRWGPREACFVGSGACDDELAICDDRDRWRKKKEAEFYNQKYNELIWDGLGTEDDDD